MHPEGDLHYATSISSFSQNAPSSFSSFASSTTYDLYTTSPETYSSCPPRHLLHDNIHSPIFEEQPGFCCSDELDEDPAEPVTPTSGRHSDDLPPDELSNHLTNTSSLDEPYNPQFDYPRPGSHFTTSYQAPVADNANGTPKPNPAVIVVPASPATPLATHRRDSVSADDNGAADQSPSHKEEKERAQPKQQKRQNEQRQPASPTSEGPQKGPTTAAATPSSSLPTPTPSITSRRPSIPNIKRTMTNLFRRSNSNGAAASPPVMTPMTPLTTSSPAVASPDGNSQTSPRPIPQPRQDDDVNMRSPSNSYSHSRSLSYSRPPSVKHTRRFSVNRSSNTTSCSTPPSPPLPCQETDGAAADGGPMSTSVPQNGSAASSSNVDFDDRKKNRSSTGLTLRGRTINFLNPNGKAGQPRPPRRANSFDIQDGNNVHRPISQSHHHHHHHHQNEHDTIPPERQPWAMPPDSGTGAKARRMSLSLPDDFTVDVTELSNEFEYCHKLLGRHGKHLGKGVASKVALIHRKGFPEELYAVKEFRGKSHRESKEEYEKKIKSEYSIAKSLHHPGIVETIRLCTDHSRWDHVMEYCSEGDLFSLVSKNYLRDESRKSDRLCLFKQLAQGVAYLHQNGIAHRDIKLENLLMTKDSKLKITDFGVSEVFCGTHPGVRESGGQCGVNMGEVRLCAPGICGSEPYIAPEVLSKKGEYDPRPLDVWSTAIVMIYLTFGGAIWNRAAEGNPQYDNLVRGWNKWYAAHPDPETAKITETDYPNQKAFDTVIAPPALRRLMLQMLNPDPKRRISMEDVVKNRWFKNIECCQPESYDDPALVIDATKPDNTRNGPKKIFCHNHLPTKAQGHSLGKMPGQPGY
ncbi:STYKc [Geosmithia morbida]|uniref:STYKc n=1 Tax=Geosmithia morbida TaxID=1094350 RepID=A0A9P5D1I0_9HYPO|nr:STYKc [Geosmithia morbida]KAF4119855.1 STYKc [Geosmithia morbida]